MGIKELSKSIGPWAMPEDAKEAEDGQAVRKASRLMGRGKKQIATTTNVSQGAKHPQRALWEVGTRPPQKHYVRGNHTSSESIVGGWYPASHAVSLVLVRVENGV